MKKSILLFTFLVISFLNTYAKSSISTYKYVAEYVCAVSEKYDTKGRLTEKATSYCDNGRLVRRTTKYYYY